MNKDGAMPKKEKYPAYYRIRGGKRWQVFAWWTCIESLGGGHFSNGGKLLDRIENRSFTDQEFGLMRKSGKMDVWAWSGAGIELGTCQRYAFDDEFKAANFVVRSASDLISNGGHSDMQANKRPIEPLQITNIDGSGTQISVSCLCDGFELPIFSGDMINVGEWIGGVGNIGKTANVEGVVGEMMISTNSDVPNANVIDFEINTIGTYLESVESRRASTRRIVPEVSQRAKQRDERFRARQQTHVKLGVDRQISLEDDE